MAPTGNIDGLSDSFAVAYSGSVNANVEFVFSKQAVLDDFQVQFTHAADKRLPRFFVLSCAEGGILASHYIQHAGEFLSLGGSFRLDCHGDDRFGKLD